MTNLTDTSPAGSHDGRPQASTAASGSTATRGVASVAPALLERLAGLVSAPPGRPPLDVITPATGNVFGTVPQAAPEDMIEATHRARKAQQSWATTPFAIRSGIFLRFHDMILDRQDEILDIIQLETGKARLHAFDEVADTALVARYYAYHAADQLRPRRRKGALPVLTTTREYFRPRGVVGFIAPWNYPLSLSITDAIPALIAGNAVVLKPDAQTPFTALWALDLLREAGLPEDLFEVVTGRGSELGTPLIENVDYIGFTGSTATGRIVARQAGENLIGCSLELGGKNPMIVLEDAALDQAVEGALRACFSNAGQLCISIERMYVSEQLFDEFSDRFARRISDMVLGADLDYSADMGSLVSAQQLRTVSTQVDDAVGKGAQVIAGGKTRPDLGPFFYEPTVLVGVEDGMTLYREETFGPVVSLYSFRTVDEAVERANDTNYGLNASVWTRNIALGQDMASRIGAGSVNINEAYAASYGSTDAPMGGFKDSGLGRRHGAAGIVKYTEPQTVAVQRLMPLAPPPGVTKELYAAILTQALRVLRHIPGMR